MEEYDGKMASLCSEPGFGLLWRREFLLASRLRTDGIYIATCGYPRRIAEGASVTDKRQSMMIRYYRLLRFLPPSETECQKLRKVLVLRFDGDVAVAVEALKTHPAGQDRVDFG